MQVWLQPSVSTRRGGSCTRGGKPDASGNPGRPEGLPRTAAIKRHLILARVSTPVRRVVSDTGSVGGQHFQDKPMGADSVRRIFPRTGYLPAISCPQALSQASLPQAARSLLELACLRWPRWGAREFAAPASRASPAPTGWRGLCWSWLACDGVSGVPVSARRLYRGQARLLQVARALLELACLRWRRWGACECAAFVSRASPAPTGRLACDAKRQNWFTSIKAKLTTLLWPASSPPWRTSPQVAMPAC